jgi:peptide/nickel transport system substrate-binding protein
MDTKISSTVPKNFSSIKRIYKSLSPEKVILIWLLSFTAILLFFFALVVFNERFLTVIPTYGGTIKEGIIGTPRFINPVLATSDQDKDMTMLVFAGLTKKDTTGKSVLDMAESVIKSEDSLHYDVTIRDDAYFHDSTPVTSDDIMYTISLIQNPNIKSPHRIEWEGVSVEKINSKELRFSLKKPFPFFMDTLSIGILPKNTWKNLTEDQISLSDFNIHAVGSGPYSITETKTNSGIPTTFILEAHKHYTLGRPYIQTITINTYQNEKFLLQALEDGNIDRIHGISPEKINGLGIASDSVKTTLLPRTFTVFFNPNRATLLSEKEVRLALREAINKDVIVQKILLGYGKVIEDPYPFDDNFSTSTYNPDNARALLSKSKAFKKASSTLQITLSTANTEEMKAVAEMIQRDWEAIGVKTSLAVYEVADLNQSVIKDRDFEALLFGSITQNPSDLYAFWHSSQRNYPGLNISNYVSKELDGNLEMLRASDDDLSRISAYDAVKKEFREEAPGIFLFTPSLIYITKDKVETLLPENSFDSSSRFTLIQKWYRYTEKVWGESYYKNIIEKLENSIH